MDYTYSTEMVNATPSTGTIIFYCIVFVLVIVAQWKLFSKAGKPGWACLIPIYNLYVLFQIAGMPGWYFIFTIIPIVNIYFAFKLYIRLSKAFGHGVGFGLGLLFLNIIFLPILAFGSSEYVGIEE